MFKLIKNILFLTVSLCTFSYASLIDIEDEQKNSTRNLSSILDLNDYILKDISDYSGNQETSLVNKRFSTIAHDVPALWNKHVSFQKSTPENIFKVYSIDQFQLSLSEIGLHATLTKVFNTINNFDELATWIRNNALKVVRNLDLSNIKYFEHSHVHTFDFSGSSCDLSEAISANSFIMILKSPHIRELNLGYNGIEPQGIISIAEGLQVTKAHTINFHYNSLGDEGSALLGKYVRSSQLEHIVLSHNQISSEGAINLIKALKGSKVKYLELYFNKIDEKDIPKISDEASISNIDNIKFNF